MLQYNTVITAVILPFKLSDLSFLLPGKKPVFTDLQHTVLYYENRVNQMHLTELLV